MDESCWLAFLEEYGGQAKERRLRLYRLMQMIDASAGNYHEPASEAHAAWRQACLSRLPDFVSDLLAVTAQ